MGSDSMSITKIVAAVLIFTGVYLVSKPSKLAKAT
jgi:drug/metabolite transporter (DMT)-like permease